MNKETIMIDGVRYYADRPRSCIGCFFWKNRKVGCTFFEGAAAGLFCILAFGTNA